MVRIGSLDRRLSFQRRARDTDEQVIVDEFGHPSGEWEEITEVWGNVRPIGTREALQAKALAATLTHTIAVRYRALLDQPLEASNWRILCGTRIWNILGVRDLEDRRRFLIFDVEEGTVDGN